MKRRQRLDIVKTTPNAELRGNISGSNELLASRRSALRWREPWTVFTMEQQKRLARHLLDHLIPKHTNEKVGNPLIFHKEF